MKFLLVQYNFSKLYEVQWLNNLISIIFYFLRTYIYQNYINYFINLISKTNLSAYQQNVRYWALGASKCQVLGTWSI